MITREALRVLENNLVFAKHVRRDFDKQFGVAGAKIGQTLNIRKPPRFIGRTGQALALEAATETSVPLVLNTQFGVDFAFSSQDLVLSIDDFSERFLKPNVAAVANRIDFDGLGQYVNVANEVGAPGTVPNALLTYLQAGATLDNEACPKDNERAMIVSPLMQATIVDTLKGLYHSGEEIEEQYKSGNMGLTGGFKWSMDQNVRVQTVGALGGTPLVNGAGQTGNSILTKGWTASVTGLLNPGDIVTFAGANGVNPQNRQSLGAPRQFVVTQQVNSDGSGNATIPISGPGGLGIVTTGAFQTVTASPTNNGAVTVSGTAGTSSPRGLAFHREAFAVGCADLPMYDGIDQGERLADDQVGFSIRMIRAYDINLDRAPTRTDVLYGWVTLYPEMACRVAS
jgi:hypothetical protein